MCWQDRGRHILFPVSRILLDPPSRDTSKVDVLTSDGLLLVDVRTPYYENTYVHCRHLMGVIRRRGAACCIRFTRLPGGDGVLRRLCIRFLPAASPCPSFCRLLDVLASHDIAIDRRSSRQRTLPKSGNTSSDQRDNRS